jgi:uncharacterized protein
MSEQTVRRICWCDYNIMINRILTQIKKDNRHRIEQVVALGRGGFVPGVHLSHHLGVPLVPLMWQTRDGAVNKRYIARVPSLIVDDINDTGRTLREVTTECSWNGSCSTAVLINKKSSSFAAVDFSGESTDSPAWISFPWEKL